MNAKRTEPTRSLLQGAKYTPAANTDIRKRFAQMREQLAKAKEQR